jgi:hypothetical protein
MLVLRLPLPHQEARTKRSQNEQRKRYDLCDVTESAANPGCQYRCPILGCEPVQYRYARSHAVHLRMQLSNHASWTRVGIHAQASVASNRGFEFNLAGGIAATWDAPRVTE